MYTSMCQVKHGVPEDYLPVNSDYSGRFENEEVNN